MRLLSEFSAIEGIESYLEAAPEATREAARIALNDTVEDEGLAMFRKSIQDQAAYPPGYLNDERLGIRKRATNQRLEVVVSGRFRPTSLARFARGQTPATTRKSGVRVTVRPGQARLMRKAFLVPLRRGNAFDRDNYNLGLALRLKPGERIRNKRQQVARLDRNVVLLYGPSVDQIFRDVAVDDTPEVLRQVERKFYRQFFRLTGGRRGRR